MRTLAAVWVVSLLAGTAWAVQPPDEALIARVQAKEFEVHFQTTDPASIVSVELWYTLDHSTSWCLFETDPPQRHSPLRFVAPQEGTYGLFVVVRNQAGTSSDRPQPGTPAQQWCFVDWTPPLVQLHVAQKDEAFETTRRIALKWTAYDRHLLNRPIDLYYMAYGHRVWVPIELHLPNSGRYDWRVPDEVGGEVLLKLAVTDRVGHVVERFSERLQFDVAVTTPTTQRVVAAPRSPRPKAQANRPLDTGDLATLASYESDQPRALPSAPKASTRQSATTRPARVVTAPQPVPGAAPASVHRAPQRRAERPVIARAQSPNRSSRIVTKQQTPRGRRASVAQGRSDVSNRPTTVAAAFVGPEVPTPLPTATVAQDGQPLVVDAARALRLYRAGTYYRLRGQHGQRGDLAIAALRFQEALRADPSFADARLDLAGVLFLQGQHGQASQMYQALLSQSPDHRGALQGLALTAVHMRQYRSAKEHLMHLVGLNPNDGEAWLDLGDVCHKMGDLRGARDYWSEAAAVTPNINDVVSRARRRLANCAALPLAPP